MSEKRRDNKGRVLRNGEVQRADGMYMFRYIDISGKRRSVYSWRLVKTDKTPDGKKDGLPLRDQEQRIQRDLEDGIRSDDAAKTTVNDLFDRFMAVRIDLRPTTSRSYRALYNGRVRNAIGQKRVCNVMHSDVQGLYIDLMKDGLAIGTVRDIHALLRQLFATALADSLIRIDPTEHAMKGIGRGGKSPEKRRALTRAEQDRLIEFVAASKRYRKWGNLITVLLGTGMRVGEAIGLRWRDCDFENNMISVNHTMAYDDSGTGGKYRQYIAEPKTPAAIRKIPMLTEVRKALEREREKPVAASPNRCVIDGCDDFVFLNDHGNTHLEATVYAAMRSLVAAHNKGEELAAKEENRPPQYLPNFSPHILRHTFCTRLCECESNLKTIQEVMGHTTISVTMDVYSDATKERKKYDFSKLESTLRLA